MPKDEQGRRRTKKAKSKRNYELNGKYSTKAVRAFETQVSKKQSAPPEEEQTKEKSNKKSKN